MDDLRRETALATIERMDADRVEVRFKPAVRVDVKGVAEVMGLRKALCGKDRVAILLVIATASLFGWILAAERMPQAITAAIIALTEDRNVVLLLLTVVLLVLGTFMEALATVIILAPVLMPLLLHYGIDPVHFGLLMIVNISIGGATPPLGVNLMAACRIAGVLQAETYRWLLPMLGALIAALLVMTYWEDLVMFLPRWTG